MSVFVNRENGADGLHPLTGLLLQRLASGSTPGKRDDGASVALVVEGGGMRGVVSGGMVTALGDLRLRDAFDMVVGSSAGALAGAFFLAGQPRMGTSIYYEDLIGREWLSYARALRRRPVIALDYLLDEVMSARKPLDWERVIASPVPLHIVAARLPHYSAASFDRFDSRDDLRAALLASARIPLVAGMPVTIRGERYVDGALGDAIPIAEARRLGATHFVVLLTRPSLRPPARRTRLRREMARGALNRMQRGLGDAHLRHADRYRDTLDELQGTGGAFMHVIRPLPGSELVGQLEQDPRRLLAGAAAGAAAVHSAFTGTTPRFFHGIEPVTQA